MKRSRGFAAGLVFAVCATAIVVGSAIRVGQIGSLGIVVSTAQAVAGTGSRWSLGARPVDIVSAGNRLFVRCAHSVIEVSPSTGAVVSSVDTAGASLHGLAVTPDHQTLFATGSGDQLYAFDISKSIQLRYQSKFAAASVGGQPYPCGVAVSSDSKFAYVCLSRSNLLAKVDVGSGTILGTVPVAPAPFDVALFGNTAVVTSWGRTPRSTDASALSSGTEVQIDSRGIATGGTVSFVNLITNSVSSVSTGGQPSQIAISSDGKAFIPCANGDLLTQWSIANKSLDWSTTVKADSLAVPGLAPNAVLLSPDQKSLYVACGGLNAIAIYTRAKTGLTLNGFVSTDWYPTGVVGDAKSLYVVNAKGIGSRSKPDSNPQKSVYDFTGTITRIGLPITNQAALTTRAISQATFLTNTVPIPSTSPLYNGNGKTSPIQHVIYVIKENRTYDQVFGDLTQGDGNSSLTIYGRSITPNMHAIAEQFVLLDNFYCDGVLSADGHAWAVEGNATSFFERSFGGWTRSYPFGDDPISPNSSGFIWNDVLAHHKTFRNYGEFDYAQTSQNFTQNLSDLNKGVATLFGQDINTVALIPYSDRKSPGWNLEIPDQVRASRFITDFKAREKAGTVPSFSILYLPEDHTGASVGANTCVSDNDRGLGMVVDAVSHSSIWKSTAIFVVEDDPQAGFDHVDGHRSPCLVISPYTKRKTVIKDFYNQSSVLRTIETILDLPAMNRMDAGAPIMTTCFQSKPDLTPFTSLNANFKIGKASDLERSAHWNVSKPDQIDEDKANRLLWKLARPTQPYPYWFAGAHGRGLAKRGLRLAQVSPGSKASDD